MTSYEIYVFLLCLVVFVLLTGLFTVMILYILRLMTRLIEHGAEDNAILTEYQKTRGVKKCKGSVLDCIFSTLFCVVMFIVFGFSVYAKITEKNTALSVPQLRVVLSDSMSEKYENNKYLFDNDLNDQFKTFDLIVTRKLPDEFDLELYDIVVYEVDDTLVVHRIVGIEEPNEKHPDHRYFRLQGDFVHYQDKFPVLYSQMRAIYQGERIPFVGSFVAFLQSPAGYLCVLLMLFGIFSVPAMERKLDEATEKRLALIKSGRASYIGISYDQIETATIVEPKHSDSVFVKADCVVNLQVITEEEYERSSPKRLYTGKR